MNKQTNQKKKKSNLLKNKRNVEVITAGRLLRALERMIHEEMWKSKFEQSSEDKKGGKPKMIGDPYMFSPVNVYFLCKLRNV